MKSINRFAGILFALIGALGCVLSGLAVSMTWSTARSLRREVPNTMERLESVGRHVRTHGEAAVSVLDTTRQRLASILLTVEELSQNPEQRPEANVIDRLDAEVVDRLDRAEEFIRSLQGGLDSAGRALVMLESIPLIGLQSRRTPAAGEDNLKSLSGNLSDISHSFDELLEGLSNIQSRRTIAPADTQQLKTALLDVDAKLGRVQVDLSRFSDDAGSLVDRLAAVKSHCDKRIQQIAIACTLFLICFGGTQLHLLLGAWRMLRGKPSSAQTAVPV